MNQRPGKTHKAALGDGSHEMTFYKFITSCATVLARDGDEDGAFYFNQIKEHLEQGGSLSPDPQHVSRILGI
jgi:hypothetical protein